MPPKVYVKKLNYTPRASKFFRWQSSIGIGTRLTYPIQTESFFFSLRASKIGSVSDIREIKVLEFCTLHSSLFFDINFFLAEVWDNLGATGRALRMQKLLLHNVQPSAAHPGAIRCAMHLIDVLKAYIEVMATLSLFWFCQAVLEGVPCYETTIAC